MTGRAAFVDDLDAPGALHGATVRSPVARGRLRGISFDPGVPWEEVVVVTAADIPGVNRVEGPVDDQPFLVPLGGEVRHAEEALALVAHRDPAVAERARRALRLDIEPLPPVLGLEASLACDPVIWGEANCFRDLQLGQGDPDAAWAAAHLVLEGTYATGAQEHLYLEPQGMLAEVTPGPEGPRVTVWGSLQCPFYVRPSLAGLLGLPPERVRVVQAETGGAFGGKEDHPSLVAGHAALLAWKAGRPVKLIYGRAEDMAATTKRHPSRSHLRAAFDAGGHLQALEVDLLLDGGAYATLSPVVLARAALHAAGVYRCPATRIRARAMATNLPPAGAFRGFGAPQALFAIERHMEVAAARLGLDPVELRRRNLLRRGDRLPSGQVLTEEPRLEALLDRTLAGLGWEDRRAAIQAANHADPFTRRGLGLALGFHGCGFVGTGEGRLASVAGVEGLEDGRVRLLAASTEMGQGKDTVFTQIVAEALGIPMDLVAVAPPDTQVVPDSGPTVSSRSTMMVGALLEEAAQALLQRLLQEGWLRAPYGAGAFREAVRRAHAHHGSLRHEAQYRPPADLRWDEAAFRGDAYPGYSWVCQGTQVAVDLVTYEARVEAFLSTQEVGRVVNPILAEGQVQGGVAQGIGWALREEVVLREGRMANAQMTNYLVPTAPDLPPIGVQFLEPAPGEGTPGPKGLGELPMDAPAPAVLNALQDALGPHLAEPGALDTVPMTPERLLDRLAVSHG